MDSRPWLTNVSSPIADPRHNEPSVGWPAHWKRNVPLGLQASFWHLSQPKMRQDSIDHVKETTRLETMRWRDRSEELDARLLALHDAGRQENEQFLF
jgi:hypothetical protein